MAASRKILRSDIESDPVPVRSPRTPLDRVKPPREWRSRRPARAPQQAAPRDRAGQAQPAPPDAAPVTAPAPRPSPESQAATPAPAAPPAAADLPARYGVDRLVLLVRDPWWAHSWWELTDARLQEGRMVLGPGAALVLRLYDISLVRWDGHNHHSHFDIEVGDAVGNWYIEFGKPGGSYLGELGLRDPDGRFLALLRSNVVTLPRDGMSDVVDEEWMIVEEDYRRMFELSGGAHIGLGSGEIQRLLEARLRAELASGGVGSFGISSLASRRTAP